MSAIQVAKEEIRRKIIASAEDEFSSKGFASASVRNIASNADISAGNLYKYYSGKEKLFLSLVLPVEDECIGMIERTFDLMYTSPAEFAHLMADYVGRYRKIFIALTTGPSEHYAAFLNRFAGCISRKLREFAAHQMPETVESIGSPMLFDSIAAAYLGGLRPIMEGLQLNGDVEIYLRQHLQFLFGNFCERLKNLTA